MKKHGDQSSILNFHVKSAKNLVSQEFQLIDSVPDSYKCFLCKQVVNNPIQTPCGCRYCQNCIKNYLQTKSRYCPSDYEDCKETLLDSKMKLPSDVAAIRFINSLKVKCKNEECEFIIFYRDINNHLAECEFGFISCSQCRINVKRKSLSKHQKELCEERKEKCNYCNENLPYKELKEIHNNVYHKDLCKHFIDKCPFKCEIVDKVLIVEHRLICSSKPLLCSYVSLGCDFFLYSCNLDEHFSDNIYQHNCLLIENCNNMNTKIKQLCSEIPIETEKLENLRKSCDTSEFFSKCFSQLSNIEQNKIIPEKSSNNIIFKSGNFIWNIKSFSYLKTEAKEGRTISLISEPFFSSEFGYKLCMKIYPYGDGIGKGTHLSVFFTIMKGEYDDILSWPFKSKVTLSILDQNSRTKNFSETFTPDMRSTCVQKPNSEFNIASGNPKFLTFNQLENYMANDCFYLKISVGN